MGKKVQECLTVAILQALRKKKGGKPRITYDNFYDMSMHQRLPLP